MKTITVDETKQITRISREVALKKGDNYKEVIQRHVQELLTNVVDDLFYEDVIFDISSNNFNIEVRFDEERSAFVSVVSPVYRVDFIT